MVFLGVIFGVLLVVFVFKVNVMFGFIRCVFVCVLCSLIFFCILLFVNKILGCFFVVKFFKIFNEMVVLIWLFYVFVNKNFVLFMWW